MYWTKSGYALISLIQSTVDHYCVQIGLIADFVIIIPSIGNVMDKNILNVKNHQSRRLWRWIQKHHVNNPDTIIIISLKINFKINIKILLSKEITYY